MIFHNRKISIYQPLAVLGILITFLLPLISCSNNPTEPANVKDNSYLPLAVGNNWIYGFENNYFGNNFSWTVVQINGDTALLERPQSVGTQCESITIVQKGAEYLVQVATDQWDPFYRFIPDSSWIHRSPFDCDDFLIFKAFIENSTIVTPAGNFNNCLRLERQTNSDCSDAGVMVEWWAPGVGLVKWEELNFYAGGPIVGHLVSYHLYNR